ncbi:adenosine receptor A3-like [Symsagittifera roscoffensis]|uniref:adenosine receptor A3-like n=1 Tax=Symsagittifera roscoffensis TaxID=84072 RepID=UPI00307CBF40
MTAVNDTSLNISLSGGMGEGEGEGDYSYSATKFDIGVIVLRVIITLFGLPANAMVIFVVCKFSEMKTYSNIFCASLAVTDNLTLLHDLFFSIPSQLLTQMTSADYTSIPQCLLLGVGNILTVTAGFHLAVIALDRFLFINFPFRYYIVLQWAKTPLLLACWLPGIIIGLGLETRACTQRAFVDSKENIIMRASLFSILTVVVVCFYTSIFKTALHQRTLIRRSMPVIIDSNGRPTTAGSELDSIGQQIRALVGYILIGLSTLLTWVLPIIYLLIVHIVIMKYDGQIPPSDISTLLLVLQQLLGVFMSLNSAINPIIYSYTQRPFKDSFAKVFKSLADKCRMSIYGSKSPSITQVVDDPGRQKGTTNKNVTRSPAPAQLNVNPASVANVSSSSFV